MKDILSKPCYINMMGNLIERYIKEISTLNKALEVDSMPFYDENNGEYDEWPDQTGENK